MDKQFTVGMRVERLVYVTVTATSEDQARAKAEALDIEGEERIGDTINARIVSVVLDED
jgi:hypothetical protein